MSRDVEGVDRIGARPEGLRVRGGPAGTMVGLDDLEAAAAALADVSREAALVAFRAAAGVADADVVAGSVLSPATGAMASAGLAGVAGPAGVAGEVAALIALAATVHAAAASYRAAEAVATAAVEQAQDTVMFVAGGLAPGLLVGFLALDALGVDVAAALDRVAFEQPAVVDLAGGVEGFVAGLRADPLTAPLVPVQPRAERGSDRGSDRGSYGGEGPGDVTGEGPGDVTGEGDRDYEVAVGTLADSAALWGLLSDSGSARVRAEPVPRPGARVPRSLRDLAADQQNLSAGDTYLGHVRVIEVPQVSGSAWVVEISGTQVWDPTAGANPFDITSDVRSMAQEATVLADGVQRALSTAQAASPSGAGGPDPVMLVGHSLGGIAAAGLASSPRFTQVHEVTHVVTMGSPVGRMPVPAGIEVLSLEHSQDAVPRLDGQRNPDRATWVTVTRDLEGEGVDRASQAHGTRLYVDTATVVDNSADPSVAAWRATSAPFFAGDAHGPPVVRDFTIERVKP